MAFDAHDPSQLDRYSRQLVMSEGGLAAQRALGAGRVLVVGAGGLGAPLLQYLAAAGVGTLGVADGDRIEASNLQRQVLYGTADIGRAKAEVACERLRALNPHVEARPLGAVDAANVEALVAAYDVVVDASDNFPTRFLLNDACHFAGRSWVHAGILHGGGQVTTFVPGDGPCYRCFFPEAPARGLVPNCREAGVWGPVAGLAGSVQALEVIKLLTGALENTLRGTLWLFDAWGVRYDAIALPRDPACPLCGDAPLWASFAEALDDADNPATSAFMPSCAPAATVRPACCADPTPS